MLKAQKLVFFLFVVLLLTVMIVGILFYAMPSVSAEETTDKYVVFNQYVKNGNFVDATGWHLLISTYSSISVANNIMTHKITTVPTYGYEAGFNNNSISYNAGHIYYNRFYVNPSRNARMSFSYNNKFSYGQDVVANTYNMVDVRYTTVGSNYPLFYLDYQNSTVNELTYYRDFIAIDLTKMFGAGNEPDIETCRKLFVSGYYPYNIEGSVISLDGFSNYSQGVVDTNKSYSTTLTYSMLSRTAFLYDNLGASELDSIDYTSDNKLALLGVVGLPLNSIIRAGSTLIVSCGPSELVIASGGAQINIAYLYNNKLVPCGVLFSGDQDSSSNNILVSTGSINFSMPYDVDTIFIYCSNLGSTVPSIDRLAYIADLRVSFSSYDNSIMINSTWNSGFESGYNSGYNKGYNKGLAVGADKQYSFTGLLDAVIQAPITALVGSYDSSGKRVGGLLNFEFLGVNLSYFFTGLISVTIVIVIIRFILSRK